MNSFLTAPALAPTPHPLQNRIKNGGLRQGAKTSSRILKEKPLLFSFITAKGVKLGLLAHYLHANRILKNGLAQLQVLRSQRNSVSRRPLPSSCKSLSLISCGGREEEVLRHLTHTLKFSGIGKQTVASPFSQSTCYQLFKLRNSRNPGPPLIHPCIRPRMAHRALLKSKETAP